MLKQTLNIELLTKLGERLKAGVPAEILEQAIFDNPIFTIESIYFAVDAITKEYLNRDKIIFYLEQYSDIDIKGRRIAVIMAGNIPLVGISDLISVIICNGTPLVKPSSKDKALMMWIVSLLSEYGVKIELLDEKSTPDSVIATGSDASNIIFKQKYGHLPLLVRGSRTSIAIISEIPSNEDAVCLFTDMFQHSSLGCRNVTHLLINSNLKINDIAEALKRMPLTNSYITNNYRQKRAMYEIMETPFIDCNSFLLRKSTLLDAAIGEITYSQYHIKKDMGKFFMKNKDIIQCVVGKGYIPYGQAQRPTLCDWADGIDTIKFLCQ